MIPSIWATIPLILRERGITEEWSALHHLLQRHVTKLLIIISRHTVVCRAAKKAGDHTMSIFTGRKKTAFSLMHSFMAPSPKHTIFAL